jgi:hypothetical protein
VRVVRVVGGPSAVRPLPNEPSRQAVHSGTGEVDPEHWTTRNVKLIGVHCSIPRSVMAGACKRYSASFKARVALEAAKQTRTLAELSKAFQAHPVRISQRKKQLLDGAESLFADGRRREHDRSESDSGGGQSGQVSRSRTAWSGPIRNRRQSASRNRREPA